jgi:hypothetical protein
MATMTYSEATSALAPRAGAVSPAVRTPDHLTFVVEYGDTFHLSVAMHALYQPLREALAQLPGWAYATATRTGWQHLTAYLQGAGHAAWTAALPGPTERFVLREVAVDATRGPAGLWLCGTAEFAGTWSASLGVDLLVLSGTTAVTLDGTPGLPGFLAPAVAVAGEAQVPLHGAAQGSTWLWERAQLARVTFDASLALDLERVYLAVAGIFYGDAFTWQEFLEGWEALFGEGVFGVQIQRASYTLALRSSAQMAEAERRYTAQLHDYFWMHEEDAKDEGARHPVLPLRLARY